jgi:hypothetical protein
MSINKIFKDDFALAFYLIYVEGWDGNDNVKDNLLTKYEFINVRYREVREKQPAQKSTLLLTIPIFARSMRRKKGRFENA